MMNQFELMRAAEAARDEKSRQRFQQVLKEHLASILTSVAGYHEGEGSGSRWPCFLGDHGYSLSVRLAVGTGRPVILCDQGCDPRALADQLESLKRLRHQKEHQAMIKARSKTTVHNPQATNIMGGGGRSWLIPGAERPVSRPDSAVTFGSTTGGAK